MREFEKSKGLVGPEVLVRGNVPPEAACVAESLGFCQKMLVTPQGCFDPLAIFDVGRDPVPLDDVSVFISKRYSAVQLPAILPIRAAGTHLIFVRVASSNRFHPFTRMLLKIIRVY